MAFTHLHVHSSYSLLDGSGKIPEMIARVKELGMDSCALTDHGVMYGVIDFYKEAKKQGIHPILGSEIYLTENMEEKSLQKGEARYYHLVLLAENETGFHNLMKLVSLGFTEGYYYKPRVDYAVLEKYHEGIIALSACLAGEVSRALRQSDYEKAKKAALRYRDIFGEENFFLEMQDHGYPEQKLVNQGMLRLHEETGIPLVVTNDIHYTYPEDAKSHDILLCLQSGTKLLDEDRMRYPGGQFYIKSEEEMRSLFPFAEEALENTARIAARCQVEIKFGEYHLPKYEVPQGYTSESYLEELCQKGLERRYGAVEEVMQERLNYELSVIKSMGFVDYFLVVWDYINFAKTNGIAVGPGRGSAAGSIVAYAIGITDVDPIAHQLLFERFLNPERVTMPDIDVDFEYERRQEVIDYVGRKYGKDQVSQIITFGTLAARGVIRDVGRVLDIPYAKCDRLAKLVPAELNMTLEKALSMSKELKELYDTEEETRNMIDFCLRLEGLPRHSSMHAAGVVIAGSPVSDYVPLARAQDGSVTTQFTMTTIEELGLLKMDFLGLRTLTVIQDAIRFIERNHGVHLDMDKLNYEDKEVYAMLSRGDCAGVFQLESTGMVNFMKRLQPTNLDDIIAGVALYRPGPMDFIPDYIAGKKNPEKVEYDCKEMEPILKNTYGVIVYQEQVMQIAQKLAGFSMGKADKLRKAMGKKKPEILAKEFVGFRQGMLDNGYSEESIKTLWDIVVPFSAYAFNKAHSAAYGVVSYWTAYLKANYPVEYMAALLTSQKDNKDKLAVYLAECRHMGITVLPPDVNESRAAFAAVGDDIRFGLAAIRNVGTNVVEAIIKARKEKGAFTSFTDFLDKVPSTVCNKRTIDSLIKAGAFDSMGGSRRSLHLVHEDLVDEVIGIKRNEAAGQFDLFAALDGGAESIGAGPVFSTQVPDVPEWDKKDKLAFEREMLGLYVSDHPLLGIEHILAQLADTEISALREDEENTPQNVTIAGLITSLNRKTTKNGNLWAIATVEDLGGSIEVMFFPQTYQTVSTMLAPDTVVTVRGKVNRRDGETTIYAQEMTLPDVSSATHEAVTITVPASRCTTALVEQLREVLERHSGPSNVRMTLTSPGREVRTQLDERWRVSPTTALFSDLKAILGPNCLNH